MRPNELCPCGSGKKFKHCCRKSAPKADPNGVAPLRQATGDWQSLLKNALAAQQAGRLDEAAALCQSVLKTQPREFNALHLLSGVRLLQNRAQEAARLLLLALPVAPPGYRKHLDHLGLALSKLAESTAAAALPPADPSAPAHTRFLRSSSLTAPTPTSVSIILVHRHSRGDIARALASIAVQTYSPIEQVIVLDATGSGRVTLVSATGAASNLPSEFISGTDRLLGSALNVAVAATSSTYISLLDTADRYAPERIEKMLAALQTSQTRWGFSNLWFFDTQGKQVAYGTHALIDLLLHRIDALFLDATLGAALLSDNAMAIPGNLFFARSLWSDIGGFQALADCWDWAFALDALHYGEPCFVDEPLYLAQFDGDRETASGWERYSRERERVRLAWYRALKSGNSTVNTRLAVAMAERNRADRQLMAQGRGGELGAAALLLHAASLGLPALQS